MGEGVFVITIVHPARLLTRHRQHRQYRPGDQARGGHFGRLETCADNADGADAKAALPGDYFV
jgi:hypothetical protein